MSSGASRRGPIGRLSSRPAARTLTQRARATLARVAFAAGMRVGGIELSPRMTRAERRALAFWIRRLPAGFTARLPPLKLAVADQLGCAGARVLIDEVAQKQDPSPENHLHAASFIPQRYLVLGRGLFRRRVELGRILYHELCHFLWPRLGNPVRQGYQALLRREFRARTRGELGYSAEWRKEKLQAEGDPRGRGTQPSRLWREYVCESFCDTAAYVLLGSERRARHSEYTLSRAARERRCRWLAGGRWIGRKPSMGLAPKTMAPGGRTR